VTPYLTLITNASGGNQSLYITAELSLIIISPIMSYFKESPMVFTGVTTINSFFYFGSLFNDAKLFKSSLL
jgi:hypothetical protein